MSHFTVLVPGKTIEEMEEKLKPYHEYECTGIEEFLEFVPVDVAKAKEYYEQDPPDDKATTEEEMVKAYFGDHCFQKDGVWGHMTNPNAKWDWYVLGGRFENSLGGVTFGSAKDFDFRAVAQRNGERARALHAELCQAFFAVGAKMGVMTAEEIVAMQEEQVKYFRDSEHNSRAVKAFKSESDFVLCNLAIEEVQRRRREADNQNHWLGLDHEEAADLFYLEVEDYVAQETRKAVVFAFIDPDGAWHQTAEMGWWGCTDPNKASENYDEAFWAMVESLPEDMNLGLFDCHI